MSGRSKKQVSTDFVEVGPKGWFGLPAKLRWARIVLFLILLIGASVGAAFLVRPEEEEVSAGGRTSASQFDFNVERIYRFNSTSYTTDPNYNFGKTYSNLKWSPFDEEYGAGYIDIGNGIIARICSSDIPGETSTTVRNGKRCYFPEGERTKDIHNYFDVQNGGHNRGELFDVRMYMWSVFGDDCKPNVLGVGEPIADEIYGGQKRFPGSFNRGCIGATAVEFHFYNRGTLYDLDGNHKSPSELSETYLAENEREFKGILRVDDIDVEFEGYTPVRGVEHLWVTKQTELRRRPYSEEYRRLLPENCTNSTAAICNQWYGTENNNSGESWANNNAAIWMEFDGKPDNPFTLVYTTSHHASSITSTMAVVNYVLVADPEDGFYPSLNPLFEAEETENRITHYDTAPYNIPRINDDSMKTVKRFGVTKYSWYNPNYNPPGLPANCSIDGWYTNPDLSGERVQDASSLIDVDGKKLMILQQLPGDLGWDNERGAYYFYGMATCDPIHQVDNDTGCESGR